MFGKVQAIGKRIKEKVAGAGRFVKSYCREYKGYVTEQLALVNVDQRGGTGQNTITTVLLAVIAVLFILNLIPEVIDANQTVQNDADAHTLTKTMSNMGEWLLVAGGIMAGVWVVFKKIKG